MGWGAAPRPGTGLLSSSNELFNSKFNGAPRKTKEYRRTGFNCEYLLMANCEFSYVRN